MNDFVPAADQWLGLDFDGVRIQAGLVDSGGRVLRQITQETAAEVGPEKGFLQISRVARDVVIAADQTLADIGGVGLAIPGPIDLKDQILANPHEMPGWINFPLAEKISEELGLPAVMQRRINCVALAEQEIGVGRGTSSMALVRVGPQIESGIILGGDIFEGANSRAGEIGHQRIVIESPRRNYTGLYGSLEAYASETAMVDRAADALRAGEKSQLQQWMKEEAAQLTAQAVLDAAHDNDPLARRILEQVALFVGVGVVNLLHSLDPELLVLAGPLVHRESLFYELICQQINENILPPIGTATRVEAAALGEEAGIIGAAGCARNKFATSRS